MGRAILERAEVRAWETGLRALRQRVAGGSVVVSLDSGRWPI